MVYRTDLTDTCEANTTTSKCSIHRGHDCEKSMNRKKLPKGSFISKLLMILSLSFSVALMSAPAFSEKIRVLYYRYVDENGVKTTSSSIPPKYTQKGYDIVTRSGKVITVAPAPDPQEVAKEEARLAELEALREQYDLLAVRYSTVEDIYKARDRRMTHLDASIAILVASIGKIEKDTLRLNGEAADIERSGKEVPPRVLNALSKTKAELESNQHKLKMRNQERNGIHEKYENDAQLFLQGLKLFEKEVTPKPQSKN